MNDQQIEQEIQAKGLLPHQQRVVTEKADLDERLGRLLAFFQTPSFEFMAEPERSRLRIQARFMEAYSAALKERIAAFGEQQ